MICTEILRSFNGFITEVLEKKGRIREEHTIEYYVKYNGFSSRLLAIKVFEGRPPYYRKWIEVYSVVSKLNLGGREFAFTGSILEKELVNCLSKHIFPGSTFF